MLHREANLAQTLPDASKTADRVFGLDYGFKNSSWLKPNTEDNLKTAENGFLAHDYWQYQLNEGADCGFAAIGGAERNRAALIDSFTFSVAPRLNALLIDIDKAMAEGETRT